MYRDFFARIVVVQEGRGPLPRFDLYDMHMPVGQILKYQRTKWCDRNTQIRWRRNDAAIASQCEGDMFSHTGEGDHSA